MTSMERRWWRVCPAPDGPASISYLRNDQEAVNRRRIVAEVRDGVSLEVVEHVEATLVAEAAEEHGLVAQHVQVHDVVWSQPRRATARPEVSTRGNTPRKEA